MAGVPLVPLGTGEPHPYQVVDTASIRMPGSTVVGVADRPGYRQRRGIVVPRRRFGDLGTEAVESERENSQPHSLPDAASTTLPDEPRSAIHGSPSREVVGLQALYADQNAAIEDDEREVPGFRAPGTESMPVLLMQHGAPSQSGRPVRVLRQGWILLDIVGEQIGQDWKVSLGHRTQ